MIREDKAFTQLVTLQDMLLSRDRRAERQQRLLKQYKQPLVCFTLNIPGDKKNDLWAEYAFSEGAKRVREALGESLLHEESLSLSTGCEGFFVSDLGAETVKERMEQIEEQGEIGRLYDIDVLTASGEKLSRLVPRRCLLCDRPAALCRRLATHELAFLTQRVWQLLQDFAAEDLAEKASTALLQEVRFTPKPGLVDSNNSGAHRDMDMSLMEHSARVLKPFFAAFVRAGYRNARAEDFRTIGLKAEKAMLEATGGVNTHRGAIYSLGLYLSALGLVFGGHREAVQDTVKSLARALYTPDRGLSHGAQVRTSHTGVGAVHEAMEGFPNALLCREEMQKGELYALLRLITRVEDSNVLYRGGREGLLFLQQQAGYILTQEETKREAMTEALDRACIERNLSPGGCADLFALALFLRSVENML